MLTALDLTDDQLRENLFRVPEWQEILRARGRIDVPIRQPLSAMEVVLNFDSVPKVQPLPPRVVYQIKTVFRDGHRGFDVLVGDRVICWFFA